MLLSAEARISGVTTCGGGLIAYRAEGSASGIPPDSFRAARSA